MAPFAATSCDAIKERESTSLSNQDENLVSKKLASFLEARNSPWKPLGASGVAASGAKCEVPPHSSVPMPIKFAPLGRVREKHAHDHVRRSKSLDAICLGTVRRCCEPEPEPQKHSSAETPAPKGEARKTKSRNKISWNSTSDEVALPAASSSTTKSRPALPSHIQLEHYLGTDAITFPASSSDPWGSTSTEAQRELASPESLLFNQRIHIAQRMRSGTTVMVQNLPGGMSQEGFAEEVNRLGFLSVCNFLYMPACFGTGKTMGYAFVNLLDKILAIDFIVEVEKNGLRWSRAHIQGVGPFMDDMRRKLKRVRNSKFLPMFPLGVQTSDAIPVGWI